MEHHGYKITDINGRPYKQKAPLAFFRAHRLQGAQPPTAKEAKHPNDRRPVMVKVVRFIVIAADFVGAIVVLFLIGGTKGRYGWELESIVLLLLIWLLIGLNIVMVYSWPKEAVGYLALKWKRRAMEEQRKIDELEIVELDHPE
jgi:hypothetical protein